MEDFVLLGPANSESKYSCRGEFNQQLNQIENAGKIWSG